MSEQSRSRSASAFSTLRTSASRGAIWPTLGTAEARRWLDARGLSTPGRLRWYAEIALDVVDGPAPTEFDDRTDSRFQIDVYAEEWGFFFCHAGRASWIRVTDIAFIHGRDDYELLAETPVLSGVGPLLRSLEDRYDLHFQRAHALLRTNLAHAEAAIRRWVQSL
jgi:hypothetical protein